MMGCGAHSSLDKDCKMKSFGKILLLLAISLIWFIGCALLQPRIGDSRRYLQTVDLSSMRGFLPDSWLSFDAVIAQDSTDISVSDSISVADVDSLPLPVVAPKPLHIVKPDSTKFRILFFGDSMIEGLAPRLCEYANESDCDLTSVIWYGSSTQLWAQTDTLEYFLDGVNPDFVLLCLGSNELFVRDLADREIFIATIAQKLSKVPFVWISPPNWKPDTGINDLIIKYVGRGRYFDSRNLVLERLSDKAHPTHEAASCWMDTIVAWLGGPDASYPLSLPEPTEKRPHKFRQYMLKPVE